MKLVTEVLAGVVACGAAYYLARPDRSDAVTESIRRDEVNVESSSKPTPMTARPRAIEAPSVRPVRAAEAGPSAEEQHAMATL